MKLHPCEKKTNTHYPRQLASSNLKDFTVYDMGLKWPQK